MSLIRSHAVPWMVAAAASRGAEVGPLLARFALPADAATCATVAISLEALRSLGDALAAAVGDDAFGLHVGATLPRGAYGLLEFCVRSSATLRDGLGELVRYLGVVNPLTTVLCQPNEGGLLWSERIPGEPLGAGRHVNEMTLALYVRTVRELLGEPLWAPTRVLLPHARPSEVSPLEGFFGTRALAFRAGALGLRFDAASLARPLADADAALLSVLARQAAKEIAGNPRQGDFGARLRTAVHERLTRGPALGDVAAALGTSPRSLQRRLRLAGTSLARVVEQERRALAANELLDPDRTLADVAERLGYADVRAFRRAFVRWHGQSPAAWRRTRARGTTRSSS